MSTSKFKSKASKHFVKLIPNSKCRPNCIFSQNKSNRFHGVMDNIPKKYLETRVQISAKPSLMI